ncbi:acyl-CoA dehydrogenase NM domain-like protein [Epithele typhae]|uniref:acyl-CoA dehydrogenase NM domain-like protein n=1 Tax=Epithele typhae TaxID=378194 RepID=UPI002007C56C|nr:acyl-CoA dehydrogenase NM domain-like protein [Epithele typhae]KAH9940467.1 acyl-CoA dehydrogenase NM domain-like protein [Epithele typhae]
MSTPRHAHHLLSSAFFKKSTFHMSESDRALLSHERARAIGLSYALTIDDVLSLTPKFWHMHCDPIGLQDGAAMTLVTIQYNLTLGTIARYAKHRPELEPLLEELLQYRTQGQFMLTEVGHGLDITNIETTATLLPSGEFCLTSPTASSAKFMPPSVPVGLPSVAVIIAKLVVNGEDRGHRPFIVAINDGKSMCTGVQAKQLPFRDGSSPLFHSIASFKNVRLPSAALLGTLDKPKNVHENLMEIISRVSVGSLSVGCYAVPVLQGLATIGTLYSLRRQVGPPSKRVPILSFRTQKAVVLATTANAYVVGAFQRWAIEQFRDARDRRVGRGIATVFKAVAVQLSQESVLAVSERCGAQGLFAHNRMVAWHTTLRGAAIAEGDVLGLSIRLISDLLLGRCNLPPPQDPTSLLALHEASLFDSLRAKFVSALDGGPASAASAILPYCQPTVEAIGHRMAYDAAREHAVPAPLVDLFVARCLERDAAWYSESGGVSREEQRSRASRAHDAAEPMLGALVVEMDVGEYVGAPIVSDERWAAFVDGLVVHEGNAQMDLFETGDLSLGDALKVLIGARL